MRLALTGTPGAGKTSVAAVLASEYGYQVVDVNRAARDMGCVVERDEERDTDVVDTDALRRAMRRLPDGVVTVLEGHISHLLDADLVVVLRCRPEELAHRLAGKGFSPAKVRENVEAEAVDVVLVDALDAHGEREVFEVDTTGRSPRDVAAAVRALVEGDPAARRAHRPGGVDWLAEAGDWP